MTLESTHKTLLQEYGLESKASNKLWDEIATKHSSSNRYYHNLEHLADLLDQLAQVKKEIDNWNVTLFTLFYHDIIYKSTKGNNEEQSAKLAVERLNVIGLSENDIKLCHDQIIATKAHQKSTNLDTNYFTDADLSILGREREAYKSYCKKVRKEYSIYPDLLYNRGRKKVIQHFLAMDRIYKTDYFYDKFEKQAKLNLQQELEQY